MPSRTDVSHFLHLHLALNRGDRWDITHDFITSFLHFSLFFITLWDLAKSRPVRFLVFSSHLFLCLPCLLPPFTVPCKMVLARPDEREACLPCLNVWTSNCAGLCVAAQPIPSAQQRSWIWFVRQTWCSWLWKTLRLRDVTIPGMTSLSSSNPSLIKHTSPDL